MTAKGGAVFRVGGGGGGGCACKQARKSEGSPADAADAAAAAAAAAAGTDTHAYSCIRRPRVHLRPNERDGGEGAAGRVRPVDVAPESWQSGEPVPEEESGPRPPRARRRTISSRDSAALGVVVGDARGDVGRRFTASSSSRGFRRMENARDDDADCEVPSVGSWCATQH
jgi:hypothetical protein